MSGMIEIIQHYTERINGLEVEVERLRIANKEAHERDDKTTFRAFQAETEYLKLKARAAELEEMYEAVDQLSEYMGTELCSLTSKYCEAKEKATQQPPPATERERGEE